MRKDNRNDGLNEGHEPYRIVQFLPYFPPHRGGLETVAEEFSNEVNSSGMGAVMNVISSIDQTVSSDGHHSIREDVLVVPSIEIIPNFPVYQFWSPAFWRVLSKAKRWEPNIVQTHTRFFFSSFIGGLFARFYGIRWVHIEHGSDYVRLSSSWKNTVAWIYDRIFGAWILKKCTKPVGISQAAARFGKKLGSRQDFPVMYRGMPALPDAFVSIDFPTNRPHFFGFVGRLVDWKNVSSLISAYRMLPPAVREEYGLLIVGGGEEYDTLVGLAGDDDGIVFSGPLPFDQALSMQSRFAVHVHSSGPGGGLATTLLQAMQLGLPIVATPFEGADEVIGHLANGILLADASPVAICAGLLECLEKRDLWDAFDVESRHRIRDRFQWPVSLQRYREIVDS